MTQAETAYAQWLSRQDLDETLASELAAMRMQPDQIYDRFHHDLEFGTAGMRGLLGAGTNRMNIYVVRRATQALADYLNTTNLPKKVAVGYDSRLQSDVFARQTACVLAGNGIQAHLFPRLEPVPALSWAVRSLGCGFGVCITASHNPAQYNGYKVYDADGCQIGPEVAAEILRLIRGLDVFSDIRQISYEQALASERICLIADTVLDAFLDAVCAQRVSDGEGIRDLKVVYTPLNGSGLECVKKLMQRIGVRNFTVVKEQEKPDGRFPSCPYPNPEIREAMQKGLELCDVLHPDILIGTDPDCDRCGTAVPDGKGGYRLLSGNELGVILLDFICRSRLAAGTMPDRAVAVTSIVSTDMAAAVAKKYGVELRRVLTGFKYIGAQILQLEASGHPERFLFGFEESYGYLSGTHVRDKDAVNAVLLVCEAAAWYKKKGMTLGDAIDRLYEQYGFYRNEILSICFEAEEGRRTISERMRLLRKAPPKMLAGRRVAAVTDYAGMETGLPKADVLDYLLEDGARILVRPSGTEPKIKIYLSSVGPTAAEADAGIRDLRAAAGELVP